MAMVIITRPYAHTIVHARTVYNAHHYMDTQVRERFGDDEADEMFADDVLKVKQNPNNPKRSLYCLRSEFETGTVSKDTTLTLKDEQKASGKEAASIYDALDLNISANMIGGKNCGLSHDGLKKKEKLAIKDKDKDCCRVYYYGGGMGEVWTTGGAHSIVRSRLTEATST